MAIDASGNDVGLLFPQLATNHLAVHDLDLRMALRARLRDVLLCDGGSRIGVGKDKVRCMAARADGRDCETTLVEAFTMDAVHVVAEDVVLRNVPRQLDWGALLVTTAAELGHLHGGGWGTRRPRTLDVVAAVA